ncbi:hypothetical protein D3C79_795790 [compost metagenome]
MIKRGRRLSVKLASAFDSGSDSGDGPPAPFSTDPLDTAVSDVQLKVGKLRFKFTLRALFLPERAMPSGLTTGITTIWRSAGMSRAFASSSSIHC